MPQNTARGLEINLLPEERIRKQQPISRFLRWALTAGRYIVIFTEGFVLIVFLARFWLDSRIIDLKQDITTKAQVLEQAKPLEEEFLKTKDKLQQIDSLISNLEPRLDALAAIERTIPPTIQLAESNLNDDGSLTLAGGTDTYDPVTRWIIILRREELFSEVTLKSIQRSTGDSQSSQTKHPIQFSVNIKVINPNALFEEVTTEESQNSETSVEENAEFLEE